MTIFKPTLSIKATRLFGRWRSTGVSRAELEKPTLKKGEIKPFSKKGAVQKILEIRKGK